MAVRAVRSVPTAVVVAAAIAIVALFSRPAPAAVAADNATVQTILGRLNADRVAAGLIALRVDPRLQSLAGNRAAWMANNNMLSHRSYGGVVYEAIPTVGVDAWSSAEAVGATSATFGSEAADYMYGLWQGSPAHWALLMSSTFNYVGIGAAYASSGSTYASIVFAEAPDSTRPVVQMTGSGRTGRTVYFTWNGRDAVLQTHTAGLRDFDVQYRVDGGAWRTLMSHTTATQVILKSRPAGHAYQVRVRDRDRRNNLSPWSSIRTVRV